MTDGDYLWCAVNLLLDDEETLAQLCPACRERPVTCPAVAQKSVPPLLPTHSRGTSRQA